MAATLVLTVIGEDKPGLVEALSRTVTQHDGNWLEGHMSHMSGKFAGIVRVRLPEAAVESLMRSLHALESQGLRITGEPTAPIIADGDFTQVLLELVGTDQPGIVHDISKALVRQGVNVEKLSTECSEAPMSGEPLFRASARLRLPAGVTLDDLRGELETVAHSLMVDVTLAPDD